MTRYNFKCYLKDKGITQTHIAAKLKISRALLNYHLNKGDVSVSMLSVIAKETNTQPDELIKLLNKKYKHRG